MRMWVGTVVLGLLAVVQSNDKINYSPKDVVKLVGNKFLANELNFINW